VISAGRYRVSPADPARRGVHEARGLADFVIVPAGTAIAQPGFAAAHAMLAAARRLAHRDAGVPFRMQTTTYVAASRLSAQQRAMDVIANNLANSGTPGFRSERVMFSDWIARQHGAGLPRGGDTVSYTQDRATYREAQPGAIAHTREPLDVAIAGDGYFTVQAPQGPRLTRAGHFTLLADGTIADAAGGALLDVNGQPIRLAPADSRITIKGDGTVTSENGQVGQIGVVAPTDPMALHGEGGRLLRADSPTAAVSPARVVQGAVEESNVQPVLELARMMDELRQFQFTTQLVQGESDRQQSAIDKILANRA
jgi:flagellar basal-body rod protein FlgF